jgi:hypothetical protein
LGQLRHSDQARQIAKVRALVVELDEAIVLRIVTSAKR